MRRSLPLLATLLLAAATIPAVRGLVRVPPAAAAAPTPGVPPVVQDPSFESMGPGQSVPDGWTANWETGGAGAAVAQSGAASHSGAFSLAETASSTGFGGTASTAMPVTPGTVWGVTAWYQASVATSQGVYLRVAFGSSPTFGRPDTTSYQDVIYNGGATTSWQEGVGSVTVPAGASFMRIVLYGWQPSQSPTTFFWDDVFASPYVSANGTSLSLGGVPYQFSGLNYYFTNELSTDWCGFDSSGNNYNKALDAGDPVLAGQALDRMMTAVGNGPNHVLRAWFLQAYATKLTGTNTVTDLPYGSDDFDFSTFDRTMTIAKSHNWRVVVPMTLEGGDCSGPYRDQAWFAGGYNYQEPIVQGVTTTYADSYRQWAHALVNHLKDDPYVFDFTLVSEAQAVDDGGACRNEAAATQDLKTFVDDVGTMVGSLAPHTLVNLGGAIGGCGLLDSNSSPPTQTVTDFQLVNDSAGNQLCEYHDYANDAAPPTPLQREISSCSSSPPRPTFIGEFGNAASTTGGYQGRAEFFAAKMSAETNAGVVGLLAWNFTSWGDRTLNGFSGWATQTGPNACPNLVQGADTCLGNDWYRQFDIGPGDPALAVVGQPPSYRGQVGVDGPTNYYRLGEAQGPVASASSSLGDDGFYHTGACSNGEHVAGPPAYGTAGPAGLGPSLVLNPTPPPSDTCTAYVATSRQVQPPNDVSVEAWFSTTSTAGGGIAGFYGGQDGRGSNDRVVFLDPAGDVCWGVFPGFNAKVCSVSSTQTTYNDGAWHHVVATLSSTAKPGSQSLYVDGQVVATSTATSGYQNYGFFGGFWRFGWDPGLSNWSGSMSQQDFFNGAIAEVSVYDRALDASEVAKHFGARGSGYESVVQADAPQTWYRFRDTLPVAYIGNRDAEAVDSAPMALPAAYHGGVTYGMAPGPLPGSGDAAVSLDGASGWIGLTDTAAPAYEASATLTVEGWFKTTSKSGGGIAAVTDSPTATAGTALEASLYMGKSGTVNWGVATGATGTPVVVSSPSVYNDGFWHQVVGEIQNAGSSCQLQLFVDAVQVGGAKTLACPSPGAYAAKTDDLLKGWWRFGNAPGVTSWPGAPRSAWLKASLGQMAVYDSALPGARVQQHWAARTQPTTINAEQPIPVNGTSTTTGTVSTAGPSELLLAFVSSDGPSSGGQAVTVSGAGLAWYRVAQANGQPGDAEIWAAWSPGILTGAPVTSTQAAPGFHQTLTLVAFEGATGVGATGTASAAPGAPSVTLTAAASGSLAYATGHDRSQAVGRTVGSNQVLVAQNVDGTVGETTWTQALAGTLTAGTPATLNDTAPTADQFNLAAVEVLPN